MGGGHLCALLELGVYTGTVWSKLYRRKLFIDNEIRFIGKLICEDEEITPRLYDKTDKVCYLNRQCYARYQNPISQTNTMDEYTFFRKSNDRITVSLQLWDYFSRTDKTWKAKRVIFKHIYGLYLQGISFSKEIKNSELSSSTSKRINKNLKLLFTSYKYMLFKYFALGVLLKILGYRRFTEFVIK